MSVLEMGALGDWIYSLMAIEPGACDSRFRPVQKW